MTHSVLDLEPELVSHFARVVADEVSSEHGVTSYVRLIVCCSKLDRGSRSKRNCAVAA